MACIESDCEVCLNQAVQYWTNYYHMSREDCEDCSSEFLLKMERMVKILKPAGRNACCSKQFISLCARNHTLNSINRIARIQKRIITGMEDIDIEKRLSKLKRLAGSYDPETELLKSEFWMKISAALESLTPHQKEILCRRYMQMEPIQAISSEMGITRNAVRQVLFRAARIFRAKLKESGLPEEEAEDYLSLLTPPHFILEP